MHSPLAVAQQFYRAWNARDFDALFSVLDHDVTISIDAGTMHGAEAARAYVLGVMSAYPGVLARLHRVVAETADTVVTELRLINPADEARATAPADAPANAPAGGWYLGGLVCEIMEVRDDRIVAVTSYYAPNEADRTDVALVPSRAEAARIAEEQAGLRRVATLVAEGAPEPAVFAAVNQEIARIVGADSTSLVRFEDDETVTVLAAHSEREVAAPSTDRHPIVDAALTALRRTGRPSRFGPPDLQTTARTETDALRPRIRSVVGVPITVDGRTWGVSFAATTDETPLPDDAEERIAGFADLVGTGLANAQARERLQQLADEQSALRSVAELVATGASQTEVFDAVASEACRLLGVTFTALMRFEPEGDSVIVALHDAPAELGVGGRIPTAANGLLNRVLTTGRPARKDVSFDALGVDSAATRAPAVLSGVGAPIHVEGRLWGLITAFTSRRPLPIAIEGRLSQFADVVATAIAGAQARSELRRLADEQAALRRVAELVARGVDPQAVFSAVAAEASRVFEEPMTLARFVERDDLLILATDGGPAAVGARIAFGPGTVPARVLRTGHAVRVDDYSAERDPVLANGFGVLASAAAPVMVDGHVWGLLVATSPEHRLPAGTEQRIRQFADLVGAAIANAESRAQLTASRARVVATADETRRRVQRDVHDGAQQRLVQTVVVLRLAKDALIAGDRSAPVLVDEALQLAERATAELGDLVRGILPAALSRGGLRAGIESFVADVPVQVDAQANVPRLDPAIEITAYFVIAEALTNVVKHAQAQRAWIRASVSEEILQISVRDNGVGGADSSRGTGLIGLFDRVEASGGSLHVHSPRGAGTTVRATLPLRGVRPEQLLAQTRGV